jgi:hypothetical protein
LLSEVFRFFAAIFSPLLTRKRYLKVYVKSPQRSNQGHAVVVYAQSRRATHLSRFVERDTTMASGKRMKFTFSICTSCSKSRNMQKKTLQSGPQNCSRPTMTRLLFPSCTPIPVPKALANHVGFLKVVAKHKSNENLDEDHIRRMYQQFCDTEEYQKYDALEAPTNADHAKNLLELYKLPHQQRPVY